MRLFVLIYVFLVSSCTLGPKYNPPEICVADKWSGINDVEKETAIHSKWWEIFEDEFLTKYIQEAAKCNHSVLSAKANILEARALRMVEVAKLLPHLSADFIGAEHYFSKNGLIFSIAEDVEAQADALSDFFDIEFPRQISFFNAVIDASWEIDLFGKLRKGVEAQTAAVGSAIEQKNDLLISIFAEVAINYAELRSAQHKGKLLQEEVGLLEEKMLIEEERFKFGYNDAVDVNEIEKQVAELKSTLPKVYSEIYKNIYAISILVGKPPEALLKELLPFAEMLKLPDGVAIGLRSDLLRRRPDVRYAERLLAQSTALEGVAIASFFPTITFGGNVGFQALKLAKLFKGDSFTWTAGGDGNTPIFQGGKLLGNLNVARAKTLSNIHFYEQTVLMALQEAQSALISYNNDLVAFERVNLAAEKQENIAYITKEKFVNGIINGISFIEQERQLNLAEQNTLESQTTALIDLISLYKSLGGGLTPCSEKED